MKKIISSLVLILMMMAAGAPITESVVLAATKKRTCSCKPTVKRRTSRATVARRTPISNRVNGDSSSNYSSAGVVGPVYATYTLPQNQNFRLRMNQTVSSATARPGDKFTATVITPVYASGVEVVPAGATVEGRVASVVSARSRSREGKLSLSFDTLVLPDGTKKQLNGELTDLQYEKGGDVDGESGISGRSSENRDIGYIGGGGVGGAVIGGAIGGGKGAAIGGLIGAGAGVAGVMLQKGHDAVIKGGSELGMITTQPITFSVRADRDR